MRVLVLLCMAFVPSFGFSQNLLALFSVSGDRQIGTIDPTDGSVSLIGTPINGSPLSSSGTSYDEVNNQLFFVGNPGGGNQVYTVSLPGGGDTSQSESPAQATLNTEFDSGDNRLTGFYSIAGDRQIGTVNPGTGAVTLLGSPIGGVSISTSANTALNEAGNQLFFVGTPNMGSRSIYTVNTTTGVATAQALSPNAEVAFLVYDNTGGTLYAVFNVAGARQLGTINPATGATATIGSAFNGGASISTSNDAVAIDEAGGTLYFVGDSTQIYTVDLATGNSSSQSMPAGTSVSALEYDPNNLPVELQSFTITP